MTGQAPLIAELVNLAVPVWRDGRPVRPREGEDLRDAFAALVGEHTAAGLRAVPDAGARLAVLGAGLHHAMLAATAAGKAERINALLHRYGAQPYLVEDVGQPFHLHFHGTGETQVEKLGAEFATALALIMDGYGPDRFGRCEASRCEAVYIDMTRNGSRRYCGAACTARAKTAAYRDRRRG